MTAPTKYTRVLCDLHDAKGKDERSGVVLWVLVSAALFLTVAGFAALDEVRTMPRMIEGVE